MARAGLLKRARADNYVEYGFEKSPAIGKQVRPTISRPGDLSTKQFRVVCHKCNGGWMSQLEESCRGALEALVTGAPIQLNALAQNDLARWIAMKVICLEHNRARRFTITPSVDRRMLLDGEIPPYFTIYVGSHSIPQDTKIEREMHTIVMDAEAPNPPLADAKKNVGQVRVLLGRAFVLVHICRATGVDMEGYMGAWLKEYVFDRLRIYPPQQEMIMRPIEPIFDRAGYAVIENSFARMLNLSVVRWIPNPSN